VSQTTRPKWNGPMPGILGEIVREAEPHTEVDPIGMLTSLLCGAGVCVGSGPHIKVGSTKHPLLIWPLLLGRTNNGRKGDAVNTAKDFLLSSYPDANGFTTSGLSSGEGLVERLSTGDVDSEGKPHIRTSDDYRLWITEPEFSSVMARSKRDGNTLSPILREAWDGHGLSVLNRKALTAEESHMGVIGCVTPDEFRLRKTESDQTGGLYNRFLSIFVERTRILPLPHKIDEHTRGRLITKLADAINKARRVGKLTLDQEAEKMWVDTLYLEFTFEDEDAAWIDLVQRAAPYALRIAGLYAALEGRSVITRTDLGASAAVVRYIIESAHYLVDWQLRNPRLDKIMRAIDKSSDGLSRTAISHLFSGNLDKSTLDTLLGELLRSDEYEREETKTGGRPVECYRHVPETKKEESRPKRVIGPSGRRKKKKVVHPGTKSIP